MAAQRRPYGLWQSPLSPSHMAQQRRLSDLAWGDSSGALVWLEGRSGHGMLLVDDTLGDAPRELNVDRSARAQVGYGGGDMTAGDGSVYYVSDGRLYRQSLAQGRETAVSPGFGKMASPTLSPDGRMVLAVHSYEGEDCLAILPSDGSQWPARIVAGNDFYMQPTWRPDGRGFAWIAWDHPQMPWDGTYLGLASIDDHGVGVIRIDDQTHIAGGASTSVFQPAFSPDGRWLSFVSDERGWYNLYLHDLSSGQTSILVEAEAELGLAAWVQGMRTYVWAPDSSGIYYIASQEAHDTLWHVNVPGGQLRSVKGLDGYTAAQQPAISGDGVLSLIVSSPTCTPRIVSLTPQSGAVRIIARASGETVREDVLGAAEHLTWESPDGAAVHGILYAPDPQRGPQDELPPLVVLVHGGPTSQSSAGYSAQAQFLATRGYAVLLPNYRGSSGYGRAYRNALRGKWGIVDVDDIVSGAQHLARIGAVDPERMVIMGGSAGGYAVLRALILHPGLFKAGICLYGVTDLFDLASGTHKFEQHYLDSLVGPLPEAATRYRELSPINQAEGIRDRMLICQGEEDQVVPKEQAEVLVDALRRSGVPHEYHLYAGEGHGWRQAETIKAFYETLERFLVRHVVLA